MEPTDDTDLDGFPQFAPRSLHSIRLFADRPGAPRSRRPTDATLLAITLAVLFLTSLLVDPPGELSADLAELADDSPDWIKSFWHVCFDLVPLWAGVLVVLAIVRRHFVLAAAAVAAAVLGTFIGYVSHLFAVGETIGFGDYLQLFTVSEGPPEFPAVRTVAATAVLVVASPAVTRPFRFFGRILLTLGFLASAGLGVTTVVGSLGGIAAGAAAAAAVHLLVGSPGGRPTPDAVRRTLAELGVPIREIEPAALEPAGVVLMDATHQDGRPLTVKVYGRDAWDGQLIAKMWRWTWYRDDRGTLFLSRLHQVEHEALTTVLAGRAGAPVPDVLTAGAVSGGDAAIVSTAGGTPLSALNGHRADETDAAMTSLWSMMRPVHDARIVHGGMDLRSVAVDAAGTPILVDWSSGSVAAPPEAVNAERARLLVLTALVVGPERATSIAQDSLDPDAFDELVPYLQSPALSSELRHDVRDADLDLDALRDRAAEVAAVDQVELVKLRRVTVGSVLSMAVVALAAWLLISNLADIGFDTIVDQLSMASWGWVVLALIVAQLARFWSGVGTTGATDHPLRLGPTVTLEFAITFINLAVPSSAARIATKMRYFQKAGMTLTAATAMGALDSLAGFAVQVSILVAAFVFGVGGVEIDFDIDTAAVKSLAIVVGIVLVVLLVVAIAAVLFVPSVREKATNAWRQLVEALRVVRSPSRLLRLVGGNLMAEITFAIVLGLAVKAYGESAPLMSLIVVNVMVALLAGVMPIPGGIGVSEAALTAGLIAIGIPEATAFAAAITTRLCTFYLPPIWGYFALRWLRQNQYL